MLMKNIKIEYELDIVKLRIHEKEKIDIEGDSSIPMVSVVVAPREAE